MRQQPKAVVTRDKNNNEIHQLYEELCGHQRKIRELRMMKVRKKMSQLMNDSDPVQKGLHMISQLNKKLEDLKMEKKKLCKGIPGNALKLLASQIVQKLFLKLNCIYYSL